MITDSNNRFTVIFNFSVEIFFFRDKIGSVLPPGKGAGVLHTVYNFTSRSLRYSWPTYRQNHWYSPSVVF